MNNHKKILLFSAGIFFALSCGQSFAAEIRIAVASNFSRPMQELAAKFEKEGGHKVTLAFGSSGKHYAQIRNGAPFDAFFAADRERPELLEREGLAISGSRCTYAVGRLVLWSPKADFVDAEGKVLEQGGFNHIAIANPKLAPYGAAAGEVLRQRGLWDSLQDKLVRGENIGQAYQFVHSGNAELGFVAYSQVIQPGGDAAGSIWEIPQSLYAPIEQQAVLLKDSAAAREFATFLKSDAARKIITEYGYGLPDVK